uniref:Bifunctional glucose-6-phosphate/mannose-6-phosphate isomerase C-terminal domain-containing protein n=1 Tax=Fervidicoccus fontis TaxID=683846 RepID=A0A7J3ZKY6_9CREN
MLQEPAGGAIVDVAKSVDRMVRKALEWSKENIDVIMNFLNEHTNLIVSYSGTGAIPAKIFSSIVRVLVQSRGFEALPSSEVAVHIAPYREERFAVLHFMPEMWSRNETARLSDVLFLMEVPSLYIVPDANDPVLSRKIPRDSILATPPGADPLTCQVLISALSSVKYAVRLTSRGDLRVNRLLYEFSEYAGIVQDLLDSYTDSLVELLSHATRGRSIVLLYTSILEPVALSMARVLHESTSVEAYELSFGLGLVKRGGQEVYIVHSTPEEDLVRDARFRALREGVKLKTIELRTDPLSAMLYGYILSMLLRELRSLHV